MSYVDGAEERRKILSKLTLRSENNIKTLQKKVVVTAENIYEWHQQVKKKNACSNILVSECLLRTRTTLFYLQLNYFFVLNMKIHKFHDFH